MIYLGSIVYLFIFYPENMIRYCVHYASFKLRAIVTKVRIFPNQGYADPPPPLRIAPIFIEDEYSAESDEK